MCSSYPNDGKRRGYTFGPMSQTAASLPGLPPPTCPLFRDLRITATPHSIHIIFILVQILLAFHLLVPLFVSFWVTFFLHHACGFQPSKCVLDGPYFREIKRSERENKIWILLNTFRRLESPTGGTR